MSKAETLFDVQDGVVTDAYARLRDDVGEGAQRRRDEIDTLWLRTRSHLDKEFKGEFARTFTHQRFAELRVANLLLDRGYALEPAAPKRPDFATRLPDGRRVWVEVIAPGFGADDNPDRPPPKGERTVRPSPERETLLRLTSALYEKKKKFDKYRAAGVVGDDDICIVAIGGSELFPHADGVGLPRIVRAVLPAGDEAFRLDLATEELVDVSNQWRETLRRTGQDRDGVDKTPVPTTAFLDGEYTGISGVLYDSACVTNFSPPAQARWTYVHNGMAPVRLPTESVPCEAEYWAEADGEDLIVRWREAEPEPA